MARDVERDRRYGAERKGITKPSRFCRACRALASALASSDAAVRVSAEVRPPANGVQRPRRPTEAEFAL